MRFQIPRWLVGLSGFGALIGGTVLFKDYVGGGMYDGDGKLFGKTVVITGANSGFGKEAALELAKRGGRIIMACRNMTKCEEAREEIVKQSYNKNVECKLCDLASMKSIRQFAADINQKEKRLDVLINNAGVLGIKERTVTEDGFEWHLGVNYLGHFLLTNLLLDKLKASGRAKDPSRVVNIVSLTRTHQKMQFEDFNCDKDYSWKEAYFRSKHALLIFTEELAKKLADEPVCVFGVYPPVASTNLSQHSGLHRGLSGFTIGPIFFFFLASPKIGAQTHVYCAADPDILDYSGKFFKKQYVIKTHEELYRSASIPRRLWEISEVWTRLKDFPTVTEQSQSIQTKPNT